MTSIGDVIDREVTIGRSAGWALCRLLPREKQNAAKLKNFLN
jgi:hypothetical protein